MKFDLTSDLHLDFWICPTGNQKKQQSISRKLINSLLPETKSDVLVIAGDLGHYNHQNSLFLNVLNEFYRDIVITSGNHDLYMISTKMKKSFDYSSMNRLIDMKGLIHTNGIHYVDGNVVDIDGVKFGGTCMWYDDKYAIDKYFMRPSAIQVMWSDEMNDSQRSSDSGGLFNRYSFFADEFIKMAAITNQCDVIVTHIAPTELAIPNNRNEAHSTFYRFDGDELIGQMKSNAVWCYGHIHEPTTDITIGGNVFCRNPLGYPDESVGNNWCHHAFPETRKFRTIEVTK